MITEMEAAMPMAVQSVCSRREERRLEEEEVEEGFLRRGVSVMRVSRVCWERRRAQRRKH